MGKLIMKIHDEKKGVDYYMEWSTVVDAPVTYGLSLDEFKEYYKEEYGAEGMRQLPERLARVEQYGTSAYPPFHRLEKYFGFNRAGENETCLDKQGILDRYCSRASAEQP